MNIPSISSISSQITSNIFSKVDTKNQGYIDKSDLSSALSKLNNGNVSETSTDDIFSQMDSDTDGKITKDEMSKGIENLLSQLQSSAFQGKGVGMQGMPPHSGGMPPGAGDKSGGVTKDQATEMASSSIDSKLSSLMGTISKNFEAADSDQDGKVSFQEAMTYQQKTEANGSAKDTSTQQESSIKNIMQQLIKAYGFDSESSNSLFNASA